jgi:RHS repeat-associated protein
MFGARYYGSSLGRFMTPDWAAKPIAVPYAHYGNPQSLNLYSYVQNNPTTVGDPDGHCPGPGDECSKAKVEAKVTEQPKIIQNQPVDGANKTVSWTFLLKVWPLFRCSCMAAFGCSLRQWPRSKAVLMQCVQ